MAKTGRKAKKLVILDRPSKTALDPSQVKNVSSFTVSLGIKELTNDLVQFITILEKEPKKALSFLKDVVKNVPEANKQWMMTWTDERGFDILQNSIINNKSDIIHFLLHTAELFPQTHHPKMNPYAHLAATLGYLDCLVEVLTCRPDDYFNTSEPHHAMIMPMSILPPLKGVRGMSRNLERWLATIKQDTSIAERALHDDEQGHESLLETKFQNLKNSFKDRKPRRVAYSSPQKENRNLDLNKPDAAKQNLRPNALKPKVKPKITVFWDVFKDYSEGVVKGAGEPVETIYAYDKKLSHLSLEGKDVSYKKKTLQKKQSVSRQPSQVKLNKGRSRSSTSIGNGGRDFDGTRKSSLQLHSSQNRVGLGVSTLELRQSQDDPNNKYYGKSPLTMAAEKGHVNCVNYLLNTFYQERKSTKKPLTLATKAKSLESIAILLLATKYSRDDYQSAVLMSIRELYPDCLTVLCNLGSRRHIIFDRTNLFHILYSESLIANYRYGMLPEMTRVLVNSEEGVNACYPHKTYPMYTLIQCAFNAAIGKHFINYLECLTMLLNANANPHFNEDKGCKSYDNKTMKLSRPSYTSAMQCVLVNAYLSLQCFPKSCWYQIMMQKCIEVIVTHDKTPRRVDNYILTTYMYYVSQLGLNRRILRTLLRYGANPDYSVDGKYPLGMFFERRFSFLTKFQVYNNYVPNDDILDTLLILCRAMTPNCLHKAVVHFLDNHFLSTPLQALDITRKFCYHANKMITSPRSLTHIASQTIWLHLRRNSNHVQMLPVPQDVIQQILP